MVKIYNEDCIVGMREHLSAGAVDCIVTSPPYNLGIDYGAYDDHGSRADYLSWMFEVAHELHRVLSDDGSLFLNLGSKPTDPWVIHDVLNELRRVFTLQNTFIWCKAVSIAGVGSYGHYKPLNSKRFVNDCFEYMFHLTKAGDVPLDRLALGVPYADKTNIKRWDGVKADLRCRGNVWFVDAPQEDGDARWLAGLIDGEGCINILRSNRAHRDTESVEFSARIEVANTIEAIIDEVARIAGCGTIQVRQPKTRIDNHSAKQACYIWRTTNKEAANVLCRVYPYLIGKQSQAKVALHLEATKYHRGQRAGMKRGSILTEEDLTLRKRLQDTVKELHAGGRSSADWVPEPEIQKVSASNCWHVPYETISNRAKDRPHPATFPVKLVENCLRVHGLDRIRLAMDPFLGLGSSARAAEGLGLDFVGFEIDPDYCSEAKERLNV
jgi:DNA modification methylase